MKTINDRKPNYRNQDGKLYLVRCFACGGDDGTENYVAAIAASVCSFCGWKDPALFVDDLKSVLGLGH